VPSFIPGLSLARAFYTDVVARLLDMPHTACLFWEGSEVLGYDSPRSTDHEWGPRMQVFVAVKEVDRTSTAISAGLPPLYRGYPTAWYSLAAQRVTHHIEVGTLDDWLHARLGQDPRHGLDHAAWLAMPQQHLLQLTAGQVFRDDTGELTRLRDMLSWYPTDVWRWLLASQWHLIGNTEPLLGRTLEAGDRRGAGMIVYRLCRLVMEMAFLQEKQYRPYDKWFGTAFAELDAAAILGPLIDEALSNPPNTHTDGPLATVLLNVAKHHVALGISEPVSPVMSDFHVGINDAIRPYPVLNTHDLITATSNAITDPGLRALVPVGAIDQLTHSDDAMLNFTAWPQSLATCYRTMLDIDPVLLSGG
jgi:hypothetical protein